MKKYLSLILAMLILTVSIALPTVYAENSAILSMETEAEALMWAAGKWSGNPGTGGTASDEQVRMGKYSFRVKDISNVSQGNQTMVLANLNAPLNGAKKINMWVYADIGGADNVRHRYTLTTSAGDIILANYYYTQGWNLISIDVPAAQAQATLTKIVAITYGYGNGDNGAGNASTDAYKNAVLYMNGIWTSDAAPAQPEITASSVKEGSQLVKHDVGKIDFSVKNIKLPEKEKVRITPAAAYHLEVSANTLSVVFDENMQYGTPYTIEFLEGIYDKFGMELKPYTLSYRVRGEDENIPPSVEIVSPVTGERHLPSDTVELVAVATDDPTDAFSKVDYVEFYCNDVLIEGSRTEISEYDIFKFYWTGMEESVEYYKITAKAVDNEGAETVSEPISLRILDYKNPEVEITAPTDGKSFYESVGGMSGDTAIKITATSADIDTAVSQIEVFVNGDCVKTATDNLAEFAYTLETPLTEGDYNIRLVATDDMGLMGEDEVNITVVNLGKTFPAVLENDLGLAKWDMTKEEAEITTDENGILIKTEKNETASISRTLKRNLSISPWQADAVLSLSDTAHTVIVSLGSTELVKFSPDGTLSTGGKYEAGRTYTISAAMDTENKKMGIAVNGIIVKETTFTPSNFSSNAAISVKHSGVGETTVKSAEIYMLKEAAKLGTVEITENGQAAEMSAVSLTPEYISVSLAGGTKTETIEGNVSVVEFATGKEVAVSYKDGKIYFEEILKSGKDYIVMVNSNVTDSEGRGLSGSGKTVFTTVKSPIHIEMYDDGTNLNITAENTTGEAKPAEIVIAVYSGNKAVLPISVTPYTIPANGGTTSVALPTVNEGEVIEAFIVDSMNTMNAISDTIYVK